MLVFPAIDIRAGKVVRLVNGDFRKEHIYADDPVAIARDFASQGAEWIHVVDLEGAKMGRPMNLDIVKRMVEELPNVKFQFGGGVRDKQIAEEVLAVGISRIVIGSKLAQDRAVSVTLQRIFKDRLVAGLDVRKGYVAVEGWTEESNIEVRKLAKQVEQDGFSRIVLTDIVKDGALSGPNIDLINKVEGATALPIISSGGVASLDDIRTLMKASSRPLEGVIIGKALYEGKFTLSEAIEAAKAAGVQ